MLLKTETTQILNAWWKKKHKENLTQSAKESFKLAFESFSYFNQKAGNERERERQPDREKIKLTKNYIPKYTHIHKSKKDFWGLLGINNGFALAESDQYSKTMCNKIKKKILKKLLLLPYSYKVHLSLFCISLKSINQDNVSEKENTWRDKQLKIHYFYFFQQKNPFLFSLLHKVEEKILRNYPAVPDYIKFSTQIKLIMALKETNITNSTLGMMEN